MKCFLLAISSGVMGVLLLFAANYERQLALASISWPTTQGRMIQSHNYLGSRFTNQQFVKYSYVVNNE